MSKLLKQLYFYSTQGLALIKHAGDGASVLVRAEGRSLAQRDDAQAAIYATDVQGSTVRLVGHESCSMHYTAYGYDRNNAGVSVLGYSGQRKDPITGHYLLGDGYRAFIPGSIARFNSPDSLSPFGEGGLNAYCYCAGDPINKVDPSGHMDMKLPKGNVQNHSRSITPEQRRVNELMNGRVKEMSKGARANQLAAQINSSKHGSFAKRLEYQGTNSGAWIDEFETRTTFVPQDLNPIYSVLATTARDLSIIEDHLRLFPASDIADPRLTAGAILSDLLLDINPIYQRVEMLINRAKRDKVRRGWFTTPPEKSNSG